MEHFRLSLLQLFIFLIHAGDQLKFYSPNDIYTKSFAPLLRLFHFYVASLPPVKSVFPWNYFFL